MKAVPLRSLHEEGRMPKATGDDSIARTTVEIPKQLWLRAKRRALEEGTSLRALILEGLALRLAQKGGKK
jgi:hypothetical protein